MHCKICCQPSPRTTAKPRSSPIDICQGDGFFDAYGYTISKSINTELVKRALGNALPRSEDDNVIIFHSDRGTQYSSNDYGKMLVENKMIGSMSRAGCPYDNSCVEGFFATLKKECIYRRKYDTMEEIESDMFDYIELFYNRKRLHATLGYLCPVEYRMRTNGENIA